MTGPRPVRINACSFFDNVDITGDDDDDDNDGPPATPIIIAIE